MASSSPLCTTLLKFCIPLLFAAFALQACNPRQFVLNREAEFPIGGLVPYDLHSVNVIASRRLDIKPSGFVTLRHEALTQYTLTLVTMLQSGEGCRFRFRTTFDTYKSQPGILLTLTTAGCTLEEDGKIIAQTDTIRYTQGVEDRIIYFNDGDYFRIQVGCSELYKGKTALHGTEFFQIEALPNTSLAVTGVTIEPNYDDPNKYIKPPTTMPPLMRFGF